MKAAAYCRYSTDNQTENSIAYQLNAIQKYCENNHLTMVNVYTDEALSGTNTNRDGLQRLLSDAKQGVFDAVIIYDQSRLSRNIMDWFQVRETLRRYNILLFSCTEQLDNGDASGSGFLSEGVRALFNHQYVLEARSKTISGQTSRARQGAFLGGTPPLGYDIVEGKYVINPFEAKAVKLIFELYASGKGYGYIMERLKSMGVKSKRGATIANNALYAILRNERYIGVYTWNKQKVKYLQKWAGGKENPNMIRIEEGIIPPIIDKEVWNMVQKKVEQNRQNGQATAKQEYLLSGLVKCGLCGSSFIGVTSTSTKGYKTRYYACGERRRKHDCECRNINADELEALVVSLVEKDLLNHTIIERVADDIMASYKQNSGDNCKIKKEIAECDKGIHNLLAAVEKGLDSELAFERIQSLKLKKKTLELQMQEFIDAIPTRENILKILNADIEKLKNDRSGCLKMLLNKYISQISINNEELTIICLGDLFNGPTLKKDKKITTLNNSKVVTSTGCGGQI